MRREGDLSIYIHIYTYIHIYIYYISCVISVSCMFIYYRSCIYICVYILSYGKCNICLPPAGPIREHVFKKEFVACNPLKSNSPNCDNQKPNEKAKPTFLRRITTQFQIACEMSVFFVFFSLLMFCARWVSDLLFFVTVQVLYKVQNVLFVVPVLYCNAFSMTSRLLETKFAFCCFSSCFYKGHMF